MSAQVAALRALLEQRFPDATPVTRRTSRPVATGIAALDRALPGGGFPLGKLSACEPNGGVTALLRAACRTVVAGGERAAWIDGAGTIAGAFWDEGPLLVRPPSALHALRAAGELLRSGGFRLVVLAGVEPRDTEAVRLIRGAHEGSCALVTVGSLIATSSRAEERRPGPRRGRFVHAPAPMAALRLASRIVPAGYRWRDDPFGAPADVREVRVEVQVRALGWNARAELALPVRAHDLRVSLEPGMADRRGAPTVRGDR